MKRQKMKYLVFEVFENLSENQIEGIMDFLKKGKIKYRIYHELKSIVYDPIESLDELRTKYTTYGKRGKR